jgi:hypothetical protein
MKQRLGVLVVFIAVLLAKSSKAQTVNGVIRLDSDRPAHGSREICNPVDPAVLWDVVFTDDEPSVGCGALTVRDLVPGVRFMAVQGQHSLTVRYPVEHPPIVTGVYDKDVDGVPQRCVTVSMPDGLMLQRRARATRGDLSAVEDLLVGFVLTCTNQPCQGYGGAAAPALAATATCYCGSGCPVCECETEDGGFWPADKRPGGGEVPMPRPAGPRSFERRNGEES